ncbi:fusaric acid resistance family protein [Paraburkholderia sp. BL27I4N3]|nr:fusaric acid resistance family protein [Paraburkholderia sp. BL27I4N3]
MPRQGFSHPMIPPDDSRRTARASAANSLFAFLKSLPLGERLIEGSFMAVQAVAGASLAVAIGRLLHTEQSFWAAITAIAVSQHSYVDTRNLSRDQFIGAMLGGLCGLVGATFGAGYFAAYAATVGVAIALCWTLNVGSAARLGGITATIMLLVPGIGPAWDRALLRLGEVTLGTVCALLVAFLMSWIEHRWFGKPGKP